MTKKPLSARKKPSQSRSQETVKAILQAAAHILSKEGAGKFNTNYLAQKAGVSVGSVYQYFPNKEAILQALITNYANSQGQIVMDTLLNWKEGEPVEQLIDRALSKIYHYRHQELKLNRAVATQVSGGQLAIEMDQWKMKLSEMITALLMEMGYGQNIKTMTLKVHLAIHLCDQGLDHLLVQNLNKEDVDFTLGHLKKLIHHSLAIDRA